jgi:hypothetical protein
LRSSISLTDTFNSRSQTHSHSSSALIYLFRCNNRSLHSYSNQLYPYVCTTFSSVTDIAASLSDTPAQAPGQGAGQGSGQGQRPAAGPSTSSQVLFGSDLSQLDKDLIFEGLKKLYKKKVRRSSGVVCCGVV